MGVFLLAALMLGACGDDPLSTRDACLETISIQIGVSRNGRLSPNDAVFDNAYIDYYSFQLSQPATVTARMSSAEVDPYLYLMDDRRQSIRQAYSPEPGGPAVLTRELAAGCYILGASSWPQRGDSASVGLYSLVADTAQPGG